ncbi:hypothetical protein DVH02_12070 [Streptomyces corynorhini]|uniref:Uncharacterized protein n=1 Tax=Streptomyces corynorhini TaxID=2282652 RepID=A0A370BDW9_9ACTN|nr:hypothetical protein DVH02_12070 [Streptomyces corynorhini]
MMRDQVEKNSRAFFGAGLVVLILGVVAGFLWGAFDAARLFFCSSVILAASWVLGFMSHRKQTSGAGEVTESAE